MMRIIGFGAEFKVSGLGMRIIVLGATERPFEGTYLWVPCVYCWKGASYKDPTIDEERRRWKVRRYLGLTV